MADAVEALRQALLRLGLRELPPGELAQPALVLAPHFDDETLGCGGTIIKKRRAGARVRVVFMTDGGASHARFIDPGELATLRRREALAAAEVLGVPPDDVVFLGHEEKRLTERADDAGEQVRAHLASLAPQQLFAPCPWDLWPDHLATRAIAESALEAAPPRTALYGYPIWFWDRWPWTAPTVPEHRRPSRALLRAAVGHWRLGCSFRDGLYVGDVLASKRAALEEHRSQVSRLVDDPNWPVLSEVSGGRLLPLLLGEYEIFERARCRT